MTSFSKTGFAWTGTGYILACTLSVEVKADVMGKGGGTSWYVGENIHVAVHKFMKMESLVPVEFSNFRGVG